MTLAESLLLSISQRLISQKDSKGRVLALEFFINSHRMKSFIREGKAHQIRAQMQTGSEDFSSIDISLAKLAKDGLIRVEAGLNHCEDDLFYRSMIQSPVKR